MKIRPLQLIIPFCLIFIVDIAQSTTLTWTNTMGGDWNGNTNWSPNQVPVAGDDVIITNSGSYAITNAANLILDSLVLGGTNGIQTLTSGSLTITNFGLVNSNGVLNWGGGDLEGSLTVAHGGTLAISNTVYFAQNNYFSGYTNTATLTNYGTVIWAGTIDASGNGTTHGGGGIIYNAGLWQAVADNQIDTYATAGANFFINSGSLVKTTGSGTSAINWNFASTGTISTLSGEFNLNWSGPSTVNGNLTLAGTIAAPLIVASNSVLNLNGIDVEGSLTVLQGATLTFSNTAYFAQNNYFLGYTNTATLTNYGTVIWAGTINGSGNGTTHGGGGVIYNAGLWQAVTDNQMTYYGYQGTNLFINLGTLEKSAATGASAIGWNFENNSGTVTTPNGSFSMGNWISSGLVYGSATFSGGTISGTLAPGAVMTFAGATINYSLVVSSNATANWAGGDLEGSLTVDQGGTLAISNTVYFAQNNYFSGYTNTATLTNYGTVIWAGSIDASGNGTTHGGGGIIYNAGLWQAVADNQMGTYATAGANLFINTGILVKSTGSGTSAINWNFASTGTISTLNGEFNLNWSGPSTLNGNLSLSGGAIAAPLIVASNAVLNLAGVDLESSLTVLQGGTLTLSNTVYFAQNNYFSGYTNTATLTNYGTVIWAGTIDGSANGTTHGGGGIIYNAGLWQAVGDNQMTYYGYQGTNLFINLGTLEKTSGPGTSTMDWSFHSNDGILDTLTGYFTFSGLWDNGNSVQGNAVVSGNIGGIIASNAALVWRGGDLEGSLTIARGGTLTLSNTIYFAQNNYSLGYTNTATFTNYGTVIWAGPINGSGNGTTHGGGGVIYNAGLWQAVSDDQMGTYATPGTNWFINYGTLEKIGGSGTSTINWNLLNPGGIIGSQTNTLSLAGNYDLTGGTLDIGINGPANNGIVNFSGSPAVLTGTFSANLNNGYVPATGSMFSALTYSSQSGLFTNFNLPFPVAWQTNYGAAAFTLTVLNVRPTPAAIADQTVNELTLLTANASATDPDAGQTLTFALVSPPAGIVINSSSGAIQWTPAQTESPSTNTILVSVTDNGTPALSATNAFTVIVKEVNVAPSLPLIPTQTVNELTLLTVNNNATNFNIHSTITGYTLVNPPSNMVINASGLITWTPAQTQSPATNTITTIVTNSNPYDLIRPVLTSTNTFTVIVKEVNVAPVLAMIPNQTITLLKPLVITNNATESNIHSVISGYSLITPPAGAAIGVNGVITWTPAPSQTLTTNIITTVVANSNPYDLVNPHLSATNSFSVIVLPNTGVTNLAKISDGNTLTLSWPLDHTGWRLEIQTNKFSAGLGTNWTTVTGSSATNQVNVPIVRTNGAVFFRMAYP